MYNILIPFHPKIIHFTLGLFSAAIMLEILSRILKNEGLHRSAFHVYVFATIFTPFVVLSGLWEEARLNLHHPLLDKHKFFGFSVMITSLISLPVLLLIKKNFSNYFRLVFLLFALILSLLVLGAGFFGGQMVYHYGVGINQ